MSTTISGTEGYIVIGASTPIELTKWELTYGANIEEYASRAGGGATQTAKGLTKGSGSFELMYDTEAPITSIISEGDLVTLTLYHGPADSHTGSARVGEFSFSVDRAGEMQRASTNFVTHGLWTLQAT